MLSTEEIEQRRLAVEIEQKKNQRIIKKIEDQELEEVEALLQGLKERSEKITLRRKRLR